MIEARSLTRFVVVGASNTAISLATFWLVSRALRGSHWPYGVAQVASWVPGMMWSYVWNRRWAFESPGAHRAQLWRFVVSQAALALVSGVAVQALVDRSRLRPIVSWAGVSVVTTLANYLLLRRWVFPHLDKSHPDV